MRRGWVWAGAAGIVLMGVMVVNMSGRSGADEMRESGEKGLVLVNGKIWTEDARRPEAEAVAIRGNQIVAVGSAEEARKAAPGARVIDLKGRRVVPGFNDAHVHFMQGGTGLSSVQLGGADSPEEFRQKIAEFAKTRRAGQWITDGDWDHERWNPPNLPTHQLIDDVTRNNPVFVERLDGHMSLANAVAMRMAGITKDTKDVPGGVIVRDGEGNPTGVFKDGAQDLISRFIPDLEPEQIRDGALAAVKYAEEAGVTSVQEMSNSSTDDPEAAGIFRVYEELANEGLLKVRIASARPLGMWKVLADAGITAHFGSAMLRLGSLKAFADGSIGSSTAWMYQPFLDQPGNSGIASESLLHPEEMYAKIKEADLKGLQIQIHAIGDRANNAILNFYERLEKEDGPRDRRLRIEHAQHVAQADLPRFGKLKVIASMQPYHAIDDGRFVGKRLSPEVLKGSYAWKSILDGGGVLAFGSDWPVAPMKPLLGIYAAATRRTLDGKNPNGWIPEQKITVKEAVHAYTLASAYAEGQEKVKGSIEEGKLGDLVVLSEDIFTIDPAEIEKVKVDMTVFDGKVVYQEGKFAE
jgi:predicted amidohydrolase YtcJ